MQISGKHVVIGVAVAGVLYWLLKGKGGNKSTAKVAEEGGGGGGWGGSTLATPVMAVPVYTPSQPTNVNVTLSPLGGGQHTTGTTTSGTTATSGVTPSMSSGTTTPAPTTPTPVTTSSPTAMGADGFYSVQGRSDGYYA